MTVVAADHLHVIAHRAAKAGRDFNDWWGTPIETALAAVSLARHNHAYRAEAEDALDRVLLWWRDGEARRISADVAAMALAARAAADLQRGDQDLIRAVAEGLEDLAMRDPLVVPELHLTLAAWAIDDLLPDRQAAPWPAIHSRFERSRGAGLVEPLRSYGLAVSAPTFDANALLRDLLRDIGGAPGLSESCVLLWLEAAALERLSLSVPPTDNALQVLLTRRAELVERLVGEIGEETFVAPDVADYDPEAEATPDYVEYLTSFEALLLDVALASRDQTDAWLTLAEAEALFGEKAATAEREVKETHDRLLGWIAALTALIGLAVGGVVWLVLVTYSDVTNGHAAYCAAATASFVAILAVGIGMSGPLDGSLGEALGLFVVMVTLFAGGLAIDLTRKHPTFGNDPTVMPAVVITLIAAGAAVIVGLVRRYTRRPSSRSQ